MKQFIPQGPQHIVTRASFMATRTDERTTRNQRYDLVWIQLNSNGIPTGGQFLGDDGNWHPFHEFIFPERCPIRIEGSFDNWKVQKRRLRYRRMMIHAFMKHLIIGTDVNPYSFTSKKQAKQAARYLADQYFNEGGDLISHFIDVPEHQIDQQFFDWLAYEELSCW